ncbi:hypothetical protein BWD13_11535 [Leptospira santarosai serovar Grippotyphosa]|nr:hypothetical protein BWD13_11535 [Leptospira santarosai serovar Grippotyphosa]
MILKEPSLRSGYLASTVARCRDEIQNHFFPIQLFGTKQKPRSRSLILKEPSLRSGYLASTVARCRDEIQNHFFPTDIWN